MLRVFAALIACFVLTVGLVAQVNHGHRGELPPPMPKKDIVVTFSGVLKQMKKNLILIQSEDQLLTIRRNKSTRFFQDGHEIKATDIDLETPITIDANEDNDLKMLAVNVKVAAHN